MEVASATTSEAAPKVAASSSSSEKKTRSEKKHEPKREKFRFGHAPAAPVSALQVATSANAPAPPSPENPTSTADAAPPTDIQPLGPDLEHAPLITQPKLGKTRFSDEARNKVGNGCAEESEEACEEEEGQARQCQGGSIVNNRNGDPPDGVRSAGIERRDRGQAEKEKAGTCQQRT